jgi:hypothetical protein
LTIPAASTARFQCALQYSFRDVVALSFSAAWIDREARGGKNILPRPVARRLWELPPDGKWQVHPPESVFEILLVLRFDSHEMTLQRLRAV